MNAGFETNDFRRGKVERIPVPQQDLGLPESETSLDGTFSSSSTTISIFDKFPRNQSPGHSSSIIHTDLPSPLPTSFLNTFTIQSSPILQEFPYRSSILVADLDGEKILPVSIRERRRSRAEQIIWREEVEGRSSSEVDLNLSFELDREIRSRSSYKSDHVQIEMSEEASKENRTSYDSSHSGHSGNGSGILPFGTFSGGVQPSRQLILSRLPKKEIESKRRSPQGLRQIYTAGENILKESDQDDEWEAAIRAQSPALTGSNAIFEGMDGDRTNWIRRNNYIENQNRLMTRSNFVFNPLDVPLPNSPLEPDFDSVSEASPQKPLPLPPKKRPFPLKLVMERTKRVGSPIASPNWSMGTYLNSPATTSHSPKIKSGSGLGFSMGRVTEGIVSEYEDDLPTHLTKSEPLTQKQFSSKKGRNSWNGINFNGILSSIGIGSDTTSITKDSPMFDRDEAVATPDTDFSFGSPRSDEYVAATRELSNEMGVAGLNGLGLSLEDSKPPIRSNRNRAHLPSSSLSIPIPPPRSPSLTSPASPAYHTASATPNRYSRIMSGYPLSPASPQFGFTPQPLTLVSLLPPPNNHARHPSTSTSSSIRILPFKKLKSLDQQPPSKVLFYLGFLLGPWFWIYAALLLREDGERFGEIGKRCNCDCGKLIKTPHSPLGSSSRTESKYSEEGAVFIFYCKIASGIFGGIVTPLIGVAIWALIVY